MNLHICIQIILNQIPIYIINIYGAKAVLFLWVSGLSAHHDRHARGISDQTALLIINKLIPHYEVYINSEGSFGTARIFRLTINPRDIHHVLSQAALFIGDSQSMCAEAGVLGVPFIRYNTFVGRLGYLKELEEKYELGIGILPGGINELETQINSLIKLRTTSKSILKEKIVCWLTILIFQNFNLLFIRLFP